MLVQTSPQGDSHAREIVKLTNVLAPPERPLLVIEVAVSSLRDDRLVMAPIYAAADVLGDKDARLRNNEDMGSDLPPEILASTSAQAIFAAYRRHREIAR